jgi:hypothetical protein
MEKGKIVIYQPDDTVKLEVRVDEEKKEFQLSQILRPFNTKGIVW